MDVQNQKNDENWIKTKAQTAHGTPAWDSDHPDYPRKQFRRERWLCLNGPWKFAFDDEAKAHHPSGIVNWDRTIQVPFAPETRRSGIDDTGFHPCCWYERAFRYQASGGRVILHFGAVDYSAQVWVNGHYVGDHYGGHTPFEFDITEALNPGDEQIVSVRAYDDPQDLAKPRGKQDWQLNPHSIWYPRTTGIWQTVWIEELPNTHIARLRWAPYLERWEIGLDAFVEGDHLRDLELRVRLSVEGQLIADDRYRVVSGEVYRRIALSDPGIDDYRNELLWSPEDPTLIDADVELIHEGKVIDRIRSYTALRRVGVQQGRFLLNNRPYYLRLVLDQGYWPDTFMTPPSQDAIIKDIELIKAAGFNGVRKHQKIEDPNFLYWADVLGLLVWEEMPSAYRFTHDSVERLMKEWMEVIDRDSNHPCIVTWVPFNESWGVPDLPDKETHRSCVQALFHVTRTLDPTRPVVGNDGWEFSATDIVAIHDYDADPVRILHRYGDVEKLPEILSRNRPGGRLLTLEGYDHADLPVMLTEFGGIAFRDPRSRDPGHIWGYSEGRSPSDLQFRYARLLDAINRVELFSGFCYTQLTDTFQEANGLFYADRTPKFNLEEMKKATLGLSSVTAEMKTPATTRVPEEADAY